MALMGAFLIFHIAAHYIERCTSTGYREIGSSPQRFFRSACRRGGSTTGLPCSTLFSEVVGCALYADDYGSDGVSSIGGYTL